jgi:pseudaminic acid biosynthesis-associated methylase
VTHFLTPQEDFWAGSFGHDYRERNRGPHLLAANLALFARVFSGKRRPESVLELGANIGMNLRALGLLFPDLRMSAVEINVQAAEELSEIIADEQIFKQSILTWEPQLDQWDLVLVKGVLIHLNPDFLPTVYTKMARASARHVLICEYFNPEPVEVLYRGHADRLYKRDWCSEFLATAPEFRIVDYGFAYRHDPSFPADDFNWFLLERT